MKRLGTALVFLLWAMCPVERNELKAADTSPPLKKISAFENERQRLNYLMDLVDADRFQKGKSWLEIKNIFDFTVVDHTDAKGNIQIMAYLTPQKQYDAKLAVDGELPFATRYTGWYALFKLNSHQQIMGFHLSTNIELSR